MNLRFWKFPPLLLLTLDLNSCGNNEPAAVIVPPHPNPDETGGAGAGGSSADAGATSSETSESLTGTVQLLLSDDVKGGVAVKNAKEYSAVAITLVADSDGEAKVNLAASIQATLASDASCALGSACAAAHAHERIASASLYQGDQLLAGQIPLDASTGKVTFSDLALSFKRHVGASFEIRVTLTPLATSDPYDRFAVGIADAKDVQVKDGKGGDVAVALDENLAAEASGSTPFIVHTVHDHGTLNLSSSDSPPVRNLVGGTNEWHSFASYQGVARDEDVEADFFGIFGDSPYMMDEADFVAVAIAQNGAPIASIPGLPEQSGFVNIDATKSPLRFPHDEWVTFEILAKLNAVHGPSEPAPQSGGIARSGDAPMLRLGDSYTQGDWGADYNDKVNMRAHGSVSGDIILPEISTHTVHPMVLRAASVTTELVKGDARLINGKVALGTVRLRLSGGTAAAYRQFALAFTKTPGLVVSALQLQRNGTSVDPAVGQILVADDRGSVLDQLATDLAQGTIYVTFPQADEVITLSGVNYTLVAQVANESAGPGAQLKLSFAHSAPPLLAMPLTGHITNATSSIMSLASEGLSLDPGVAGKIPMRNTGNFLLWSDLSDGPHKDAAFSGLSTDRDWTNDNFVEDLSPADGLTLTY